MNIDYPRGGRSGLRRFVPSWRQLLGVGALALLGVAALLGVGYAATDVPDPNEDAVAQATIVSWSDGRELGRFSAQNRVAVALADLPEHVRYAVLAAEDRSFYENRGVSPTGIVRSAWHNLRNESTQGGSTITQQYVKNVYLTSERSLRRKAREFFLALKIDGAQSKDQILQNYLNTIYWGRSAYGIQTAAQSYFRVDAADLTPSQAAYLAGILASPGSYDPAENPEGAQRRWEYVLDGMVAEGWMSPQERAEQEFPELAEPRRGNRLAGPRGYLLDTVRRELLARGFPEAELDRGGLQVRTTFEPQAQAAAQNAVAEELEEDVPEDIDLHVALAAVRPGDGAVVAMYGGEDFVERPFNDVTQGATQPGSTFKPFALAAGLEEGIGLRSRFDGSSGRSFDEYESGRPVPNFGDTDYGRVDLLEATANSVNTVYVELGLEVGPESVVDAAVRAGIPEDTENLNANPSVVLGVANTAPIDLAESFATFAAEGLHADSYTVASVHSPGGELLYEATPETRRAFGADVSADVTYALQGVVEEGSGSAAQELDRPAAGKTGTTNNNRSAWFVGYVPQLAAAVALWDESDPASLSGYGGNSSVTGGSYPARIWTAFMAGALDGVEEEDFPEPAFVGDEERFVEPAPEPAPVQEPPEEPTEEPTEEPSEEPSEPTEEPTEPTEEPTEEPSEEPTEPTEEPTEPTREPSPDEDTAPSTDPTATGEPSAGASGEPTETSTEAPGGPAGGPAGGGAGEDAAAVPGVDAQARGGESRGRP